MFTLTINKTVTDSGKRKPWNTFPIVCNKLNQIPTHNELYVFQIKSSNFPAGKLLQLVETVKLTESTTSIIYANRRHVVYVVYRKVMYHALVLEYT